MEKIMTNHEFARLILMQEEKSLYSRSFGECQGESITMYSAVVGLEDDVVENGYIIETVFLENEPNDKKYFKGDAIVSLTSSDSDTPKFLNIEIDNLLYMLLYKKSHYHSWHIDKISFYEDEDANQVRVLDKKLKVSINTGFHPEWKEMTIDEAVEWYKDNMKEAYDQYVS